MYGIDISNYQKNIDLGKGDYDFALIKATEGKTLVDGSFNKHVANLIKYRKLIGCYHFARPDINGTITGMEKEADLFIKTVYEMGLIKRAILVLDWETQPIDRPDLVQVWMDRVKKQCGVTPLLYISGSRIKDWAAQYPLWIASWPTADLLPVGKNPNLKFPSYFTKVNWKIWQYSSSGIYPSYNGVVDLDYTPMTKEEWIQFASGMENEELSMEMQWAIDNGLFVGYKDGTYRPHELVTRNQLATVIKRLVELDHIDC